jgi:hypothetical protein
MKRFLVRLVVTLIVLYGLAAVAYGLLHYPPGERPDVGGVLSDFTNDVGSLFLRRKSAPTARSGSDAPAPGAPERLENVSGVSFDGGDARLTLPLAHIMVPTNLDRLPVASAEMWGTLKPIHEKVLPEAATELGRLRVLKSTDKEAFERDREAARARLAKARQDLAPYAQGQPPFEAAVTMLGVLEAIDAKLAAL